MDRTTLVAAAMLVAVVAALAALVRAHRRADAAERELRIAREREAELEEFAVRLAHDVLSPLGTVSFALQLSTRGREDARRRRMVERGSAALERVKNLVHGLLEFARAAGPPERGARADVQATVSDLVREIEAAAPEVRVRASISRRCFVACHPGVLTSLASNLLRNAVKYIGRGRHGRLRRIDVRTLDAGPRVRIEIEDTGPGLPPEIEPRVFEPYVRARGAVEPGLGLGLPTVKRLAEAHGGRVGVRSVPGQGCTFWFEIPKAAPEPDEDGADDVTTSAARARRSPRA